MLHEWTAFIANDDLEITVQSGYNFLICLIPIAGIEFFVDPHDEVASIKGSNETIVYIDNDTVVMQGMVGVMNTGITVHPQLAADMKHFVQAGQVRNQRFKLQTTDYTISHEEVRSVPHDATNAITEENIEDGDQMVTFHGDLDRAEGRRYYKRSTFDALPTGSSGLKKDPFTRVDILPSELRGYTARIAPVGGRRSRKKRSLGATRKLRNKGKTL